MSRQDKATTDRNARILRELVKQPDNKSCADCRKNDARWASWNLGVFLCIRCSGIHRSMGTHISKVKSIDLDIWQPEQMESVQKWGNRLANLYWECHLKAGHVPPEHKIESFIRSKYETKRWAMDGPPPSDPRVLENGTSQAAAPVNPRPTPTSTAPAPTPASAPKQHPLLSRTTRPAAPITQATPVIDLFGQDDPPALAPAITTAPTAPTPTQAPAQTTAQPPAQAAPTSNMFDLDFKAPAAKPSAKADIMSLFSSPAPVAPSSGFFGGGGAGGGGGGGNVTGQGQGDGFGSWNGGVTSSNTTQFGATQTALPTSGWGMDQSAWGAPAQQTTQSYQAPAQTNTVNSSSNAWSGGMDLWQSNGSGEFASPPVVQKKDDKDPFANLWN